jgi:DNA-binding CsgD family transcriptional regulator
LLSGFLFKVSVAITLASAQSILLLLTSFAEAGQLSAYTHSSGLSYITLIFLYFLFTVAGVMLSDLADLYSRQREVNDTAQEEPLEVKPHLTPRLSSQLIAFKVSKREKEVFQLFAGGLTINEVAQEMELSISTIKTYLQRIYTKLGVSSKQEALALLLERTDEAG